MKKSELRKLIKEEITTILNEGIFDFLNSIDHSTQIKIFLLNTTPGSKPVFGYLDRTGFAYGHYPTSRKSVYHTPIKMVDNMNNKNLDNHGKISTKSDNYIMLEDVQDKQKVVQIRTLVADLNDLLIPNKISDVKQLTSEMIQSYFAKHNNKIKEVTTLK